MGAMGLLRIRDAATTGEHRLRLTLTDGTVIERDVSPLLRGPIFEPVRRDPAVFRSVKAEGGGVAWPNGADLCPDVLIWGGAPPAEGTSPLAVLNFSSFATA